MNGSILSLKVATVLMAMTGVACAARVYFTDQPPGVAGRVMSVGLDGSGQSVVTNVAGAPDLRGIAFHRASGRIFYLDAVARQIYSIQPNGSGGKVIATVSANLLGSDLEIDESAGLLYWAENNSGATGNGYIQRAGLDGSNAAPLITTAPGTTTAPYFMFVDAAGGHVYWGVISSGSGPSSYRRATLAGVLDAGFLLTTFTRTRDIAIDSRTGTAYWCDRQMGFILKQPLSGGSLQIVKDGLNAPHGIGLDVEAEKVYWTDTGGRGNPLEGLSTRRVARCNFDGSEFENLSTPALNSEPWDLALDLTSTNYSDWRTRFFSVTATNAAPDFDADDDGAANLLEFAMGTHPRRAADVPRVESAGTGLRYKRRRATNLSFRIEVTTALGSNIWHYNGDGSGSEWTVESAATVLDQDYELVSVMPGAALSGVAPAFFRLRAATP